MSLAMLAAAGIALVVSGVVAQRRPPLVSRLAPFLPAAGSANIKHESRCRGNRRMWRQVEKVGRAIDRLARVADRETTIGQRLEAAGIAVDPSTFRARQALGAMCAGAAAFAASAVAIGSGHQVSPRSAVAAAFLSMAACIAGFENWVNQKSRRRRAQIAAQVPTAADLLCLAVVAGESLRASVERVAAEAQGPLGGELSRVIDEAAGGVPLVEALERLADRVASPPLTRLVETIAIAYERGTPLADQLQVLAQEIRADCRRQMVERSGKRQMLMLVPVVLLILPTALAFAFFPGYVALRMFVR